MSLQYITEVQWGGVDGQVTVIAMFHQDVTKTSALAELNGHLYYAASCGENNSAVSHFRHETFSQLEHARESRAIMRESLKRHAHSGE